MLKKLLRSTDGLAAVELALVMPILMLFIGGLIDLSRFVALQLKLEKAAQTAVSSVMAGAASQDGAQGIIEQAAREALAGDGQTASIKVALTKECDNQRLADTDSCLSPRRLARYAAVEIEAPFNAIFAGVMLGLPTQGRGDAVLRYQ